MSIKNLLRKAAELVVELPPEVEKAKDTSFVPRKSVEQIVREEPGPNLDQIKVEAETPPPVPTTPQTQMAPTAPAGNVEFASVYQRAGLAAVPFSAEQAFDVIHSLPAELPLDARRATVHATLKAMGKAMGVSTEGVIADAGRKVAALSAYEDMLTHQTETFVLTLEAKIDDLKAQIAGHEAEIAATRKMLEEVISKCETESARLDDVLEFFTLDQAPSRNAPGA